MLIETVKTARSAPELVGFSLSAQRHPLAAETTIETIEDQTKTNSSETAHTPLLTNEHGHFVNDFLLCKIGFSRYLPYYFSNNTSLIRVLSAQPKNCSCYGLASIHYIWEL